MTKHLLQINDHQCLGNHAHIVRTIFHLANMSVNNEENRLLLLMRRGKKSVAVKIKLKGCEMKRLKMMFQEKLSLSFLANKKVKTTMESAASSADHPPVFKFI